MTLCAGRSHLARNARELRFTLSGDLDQLAALRYWLAVATKTVCVMCVQNSTYYKQTKRVSVL